ncbi:hypothetical protein DFH06DRAFT_503098 [Mycena polygramma]|nr:hypothetical protein DFH06DRAFT_503098 [Mycena polygramma]
MFATIKRVVGGRKAAERRQRKIAQQHDAFSLGRPDDIYVPFPEPPPKKWPSVFHNSCDVEWCDFANPPCTTSGTHRCRGRDCVGNYVVSPELAAATTVDIERRRRKKEIQAERRRREEETNKTIQSLDPVYSGIIRSSGQSAMYARRRQRVPSFSSVATAPTLVRFPQDPHPDHSFTMNPLHPNATSATRGPRPSLPAWGEKARAPGQRLLSKPVGPPPNPNWI